MNKNTRIVSLLAIVILLAACKTEDSQDMVQGSNEMDRHETSNHDQVDNRQAEVAELGEKVMPFDLDATTHVFDKINSGGLQQVVVDDPSDSENIDLIQSHLSEIAGRFADGNFHDPQMIHGHAMPGLHDLVMGADRIDIEYSELVNGGQILYSTDDKGLVEAIHKWFDAQLSDHGSHAQGHP